MKKVLLIIVIVLVLFTAYIIAYNFGRNNKFFCNITGGRWTEEDSIYGDTVKVVDVRGCHKKSDLINDVR